MSWTAFSFIKEILGCNPKKHLRMYITSITLTSVGLNGTVVLDLSIHGLNLYIDSTVELI